MRPTDFGHTREKALRTASALMARIVRRRVLHCVASPRKKKAPDRPRVALRSGQGHTGVLTRARQLLSERVATQVLPAEIRGPLQEL